MNPKRDQIIGEEGSTLRLTTTERRLKPRTSPESQPRLGFTGAAASKKFCPSSFFFATGAPEVPRASWQLKSDSGS